MGEKKQKRGSNLTTMKIPFASYSNIGGQIRVSFLKKDLDKITDEGWAELKRINAHICIINDLPEKIIEKSPLPSFEEIEAILRQYDSDGSTQ